MANPLFESLRLGDLLVPNRIFLAPMTRCRASLDHVPGDLMPEYYAQRASGGLLIAEATMIAEGGSAFYTEPGIYSAAQVAAWRKVTDAVHARSGRIFLQLWHGGRACHPVFNAGRQPVAPSALAITNDEVHTPEGKKPHVVPRALEDAELPGIVAQFESAAGRAKEAGFDGVEIHAANGYLLDEFLRDGSNKRTGAYGGSIENRARLLVEVLEAVTRVWDSGRVGVRISPLNSYNSMHDSDPVALTAWLAQRLSPMNLAYLHVMRADFLGEQSGDILSVARAHYRGVIVANMGYTPAEAAQAVATHAVDAVAFGTSFLANPDLPARILAGAELTAPDSSTFYSPGAKGYTDYPVMEAAK